MSTKKILTGVVAGAAAGAALGILFAPAKGTDTRKKIADKATGMRDAVKNTFSRVRGKAEDVVEQAKDKANTVKDNLSATGKDAVRNHA